MDRYSQATFLRRPGLLLNPMVSGAQDRHLGTSKQRRGCLGFGARGRTLRAGSGVGLRGKEIAQGGESAFDCLNFLTRQRSQVFNLKPAQNVVCRSKRPSLATRRQLLCHRNRPRRRRLPRAVPSR
jgi:hypothetical protein